MGGAASFPASCHELVAHYGVTDEMLLNLKTDNELHDLFVQLNIEEKSHQQLLTMAYQKTHLPPIRLIDFEKFKNYGGFPRFPDNKNLVTSLDQIDRENSLVVFLSHCWLRGHPAAEGWDGRPHPDNANGDKFKLCVRGTERIVKYMAPGMTKCFVWLDFCCIDQDSSACAELKMLKEIVECCDLLFTPIHDADSDWSMDGYSNLYDDYQAKLWNDGPFAYLNRGWCRVEMFYAANIPVPNAQRHSQFAAGLAFHNKFGRRPQFIYGTKEYIEEYSPLCLPPLQNSYFEKYRPEKGHLSVASDMVHINALVEDLKPYMKIILESYEGDRNEMGEMHGHGTCTYDTGCIYSGDWKDNMKHGHGIFTNTIGDIYDGEYYHDKMHGSGVMTYTNGDVYDGEWKDGGRSGHGTYRYVNGNVYIGEWRDNTICGQGIMTYATGDRYCGEFKNFMPNGCGTFTTSDTDVYAGEWLKWPAKSIYIGAWKDYQRCGQGRLTFADGNVFDGEWLEGKRDGVGVLRSSDGTTVLQEGVWKEDVFMMIAADE